MQCAHATCTCEPATGADFCSTFCAENPDTDECHCHHEGCSAGHHH